MPSENVHYISESMVKQHIPSETFQFPQTMSVSDIMGDTKQFHQQEIPPEQPFIRSMGEKFRGYFSEIPPEIENNCILGDFLKENEYRRMQLQKNNSPIKDFIKVRGGKMLWKKII